MAATAWSGLWRRVHAFDRRRGLIVLFVGLAASVTSADTYKWVDEQGQVHYADAPPAGVSYEVIAKPRAPAAPPSVRPPTPAAPATTPMAPAEPAARTPAVDESARNRACVDALYQITLLNQQRPVFKQASDGSRRYLADAERPEELARLQQLREETCSDDPTTRKAQERSAAELMIELSRRCAEARDKLANYEDPATHTPDDQIARQRAFVEQYCRSGDGTDLWLGDWIRVRR